MTALQVVLMICGIICVVVSFVLSNGNSESVEAQHLSAELTEKQKEGIRKQVTEVVDEQIETLVEKTEVALDKISNTKIMEMNEFSETILKEINRNHNEVVFLYDMLNEKSKEVKTTVKDVNVTKKQVEKLQAVVTAGTDSESFEEKKHDISDEDAENAAAAVAMLTGYSNDITEKRKVADAEAKAAKMLAIKAEMAEKNGSDLNFVEEKKSSVKKPARSRKTKKTELDISEDVAGMNIQFEKGSNNNEKILKLYQDGKTNKDIAKELSLGVGEVKLVIDLYNSGK